jgi:hypothetical protein
MTLASINVTIATAVHLALVLGAGRVRGVLMAEARARIVRRGLALVMLGVGLWFGARAFS